MSWPAAAQAPLGTAFTYQGRLEHAGISADGVYDLRFRQYDAAGGGSQVGPELCQDNVGISDGLFTVELDFGAQFAGQERFLEIDVRADTGLDCASPAGFTTLGPRQRLTAAPHALFSLYADRLDGLDSTAFVLTGGPAGGDLSGTFPNPTVAGLQTRPVSAAAPTSGQVLKWDGSVWAPSADDGLTLPSSGSANVSTGAVFSIMNTATGGMGVGVWGESASTGGRGVFGWATASSSVTAGVYGRSDSPGGYGVYSAGNFAATGSKSFQIDHPLSPETHHLNHFCSEGPEPYNVYRGNVVTDARGYATIELPDYFESINRDPTYHLTVIDVSDDFVLAKVVREIQNNQFVIRTNKPHVKVSWRVEAVRNDRWVQQNGFQTVQEKEDEINGRYLHPELFGLLKELGIHYRPEVERPDIERPDPLREHSLHEQSESRVEPAEGR